MHICECAHQLPIELCVVRVSTLTFGPNTQIPTLWLLLKGAAFGAELRLPCCLKHTLLFTKMLTKVSFHSRGEHFYSIAL